MGKICIKCGVEHDGSFGSGKYCSRACANSRVFSSESKLKKSILSSAAWKDGRMSNIDFNLINSDSNKIDRVRDTWFDKYIQERDNGTIHSIDSIRKYQFILKNHTCESCGLDKWLDQPIPLELHHINGDRDNNGDDNLQVLCCNCHAQTDNWRGRSNTQTDDTKDVSYDHRIEDFTYTQIINEYNDLLQNSNGIRGRKKNLITKKYKISDGGLSRLVKIYNTNPEYVRMIDENKDLTLSTMYRMLDDSPEGSPFGGGLGIYDNERDN